MDSKKICCAAKNVAASVFTKTNIAVGSALAAVSGFCQEGSTVSVELPEGVNLTGLMNGMAAALGGVVAVALTIWAGFKIVKIAKSWLAGGVRG